MGEAKQLTTTVACSMTPPIPLIHRGPPDGLDSFMGIGFGDSMD